MSTEVKDVAADKVVDARGSGCPGPLVELIRALKEVEIGSIVEVWTKEPRTKDDAKAWCSRSGHQFLGAIQVDDYERVLVKRMK
ncbi:MAG: sulfurtransferase TusA family protein [Armatimonadetes bacterium]|nr:sulfurtransferase TusA family protein [Armatimonadota bacterium]MDW8120736.1 sulfurtransferase TusA family protein [Armatimonadota bacterium]